MDDPVAVPLGFWLRTVDSLLDSSMDELFASGGVTRRLWQVLNTVQRNEPAGADVINDAMAMFLDENVPSTSPLLDELASRGWAEAAEGSWTLTDAGRSALATLEKQVAQHRAVMFGGIDDQDYRTTVETLARVTRNLDPDGVRSGAFR